MAAAAGSDEIGASGAGGEREEGDDFGGRIGVWSCLARVTNADTQWKRRLIATKIAIGKLG